MASLTEVVSPEVALQPIVLRKSVHLLPCSSLSGQQGNFKRRDCPGSHCVTLHSRARLEVHKAALNVQRKVAMSSRYGGTRDRLSQVAISVRALGARGQLLRVVFQVLFPRPLHLLTCSSLSGQQGILKRGDCQGSLCATLECINRSRRVGWLPASLTSHEPYTAHFYSRCRCPSCCYCHRHRHCHHCHCPSNVRCRKHCHHYQYHYTTILLYHG